MMNDPTQSARRLLTVVGFVTVTAMGSTASAAILISSALNQDQTNADDGRQGTLLTDAQLASFEDTAPTIAGVTTTLVSNAGSSSTRTVTFNAVSAANGMDVTYDVVFSAFTYDVSESTDLVAALNFRNGTYVVNSPGGVGDESKVTSLLDDGASGFDVEFIRVSIGNIVNNGATTFDLDGATAIGVDGLFTTDAFVVRSSYLAGAEGTLLGSSSSATTISGGSRIGLSTPSSSFAIVANSSDTQAGIGNFWQGVEVQFTSVPEPSSAALIGLFGLALILRRRR